jgi:hypothetical protein
VSALELVRKKWKFTYKVSLATIIDLGGKGNFTKLNWQSNIEFYSSVKEKEEK